MIFFIRVLLSDLSVQCVQRTQDTVFFIPGVVGLGNENKEYFRCKYGIDLKVIPDNHTDKYNIVISDKTFNVFD